MESSVKVLFRLLKLVYPLMGIMIWAILLGVFGFLCANFLTVMATIGIIKVIQHESISNIVVLMLGMGILRGVLRYGEQYCNHFIAFKLLALIRDKVFTALRKLAPAKLEGKDKGNLISIITSDIELLEVFYAHTISPMMIALIMGIIMIILFAHYHILFAIYACFAYLFMSVGLSMITHHKAENTSNQVRQEAGDLSSFVLENLRGQKEVIQYNIFDEKLNELKRRSKALAKHEKKMKEVSSINQAMTSFWVSSLAVLMIILAYVLYSKGVITSNEGVLVCVMMFSSFSPFIALANLSSTIQPTIASARRVLMILDEEPEVHENMNGEMIFNCHVDVDRVSFSYGDEEILRDYSLNIDEHDVIGIHGKSGCGKSTLLKLMMRFFEVQKGAIYIDNQNVNDIQTKNLRQHQSYMTQTTHLFHDSIKNNIKLAKLDASEEEILEACKKANIHDYIMSLDKGYDTLVSECGDSLSGGEKQRIGLARAFLHNADMMLLDEPTSNLDSLNEKIILKSLDEQKLSKTILIISHRLSTLSWCQKIIHLDTQKDS
ncbi:MAG: amino acid ABC transporter ATP-binding/permease protein [Traorella sp.]